MANGDSVQKRLNKVRPPRVQMTYDVEIGDAMENKELPFVLGVVGDYGGNSDKEQKRLKERKFVNVDNGNFDEVLAGVEPVARFQAPNRLTGDGDLYMLAISGALARSSATFSRYSSRSWPRFIRWRIRSEPD